MMDFFRMGGYAFYVWGAYGTAFVVIIGNVWFAHSRSKRIHEQLRHKLMMRELEHNNKH